MKADYDVAAVQVDSWKTLRDLQYYFYIIKMFSAHFRS